MITGSLPLDMPCLKTEMAIRCAVSRKLLMTASDRKKVPNAPAVLPTTGSRKALPTESAVTMFAWILRVSCA